MASISKKISKNRPGSIIVATGKEKALILYLDYQVFTAWQNADSTGFRG
jgi:hypothetical protein